MLPTRNEILNATNQQLNSWVAEYVMELRNVHHADGKEYMGRFDFAEQGDLIYDNGDEGTAFIHSYLPNYAEDISAAWKVAEKMPFFQLTGNSATIWYARVNKDRVSDKSAPRAICIVALLAVLNCERIGAMDEKEVL